MDTMTQTGKMFFYQLISFAEWERSVIRERTFSGKLRRAQEGRNPGITPAFGYRLGKGSALVVVPAEAAVVSLIFQLYASGLGCLAVARRLAELGHPSPSGGHWSSSQISRMLGNPIYVGTLVYGKQVTVRGGRRVKASRPLAVREGVAPAIIDRGLWDSVQSIKATRPGVGRKGRSGRALGSQNLLAGLLRCPCGHAYCSSGSGNRQRYRYYYCGGANAKGIGFCTGGRIPQELLDQLVVSALLQRFGERGLQERLQERLRARLEAERSGASQEARAAVDSLKREIGKVKERAERLQSAYLEGDLSVGEYRELKGELDRQAASLQERLGERQRELFGWNSQQDLREPWRVADRWEMLDLRQRKQLLGLFIQGVFARRETGSGQLACSIEWRWGCEGAI